jgi:hypothetical protein
MITKYNKINGWQELFLLCYSVRENCLQKKRQKVIVPSCMSNLGSKSTYLTHFTGRGELDELSNAKH